MSELEPFQQLRRDTGALQVKPDLVSRILRQNRLGGPNTAHDGMIVVLRKDLRVNLRVPVTIGVHGDWQIGRP